MPLDPQCKMLIEMLAPPGAPTMDQMSPVEARAMMRRMTDIRAGAGEEVRKVENRKIPAPHGDIPVRIYTPEGGAPLPVLVYFHGGGWVIGDLETHDASCRALANLAGCLLVATDYRLAPEHKFPAPLEDCYAAARWVVENASSIGGDPKRVAIGGDSAGGNLTACVALKARDEGGPSFAHQLLIYPVTDAACDTASYRDNAEGYFLTKDAMVWFWNHYLRDRSDAESPYASPIRARDLRGLPPATVITAEYDPLRDEGEAYGERLAAAGVPTRTTRYDGMIHGFFGMTEILPQAKEAMRQAAAALRDAFAA
ncbi:MAG TPA: alpha/beta hydrolase [Candidatus Binatia bacterium]|nr:alpha/beta hydrolase [Candidatus Binatia bacterium]